jgi:hypothetical protein
MECISRFNTSLNVAFRRQLVDINLEQSNTQLAIVSLRDKDITRSLGFFQARILTEYMKVISSPNLDLVFHDMFLLNAANAANTRRSRLVFS